MTVYAPSEDSLLLMGEMEKIIETLKPGTVLDMGTGSGILAEKARKLLPEALIFAADIGKDAVKYAKERAPKAHFVLSDLFSGLRGRFDLILFNPPYLPSHIYDEDPTTAGGPMGFETANRFIQGLPQHLTRKGVCLLLISTQTHPKKVEKCLEESGLKFKAVAEKKLFFETLFVYSAVSM